MGLAPGVCGRWRAPRDRSCARREARGRIEAFALLREEKGLIASNARSGPIPLPLGDLEPVPGGSRRIDLEPVPRLGWSKGGRMGSLRGYFHATFFLAVLSGAGLAFGLASGLFLGEGGLLGLRGDGPSVFSGGFSAECDRHSGR